MYHVTIILIAFIIFQSIIHFIERKDLYKRIMCRDLREYESSSVKQKSVVSAHKRVLDNWRKSE